MALSRIVLSTFVVMIVTAIAGCTVEFRDPPGTEVVIYVPFNGQYVEVMRGQEDCFTSDYFAQRIVNICDGSRGRPVKSSAPLDSKGVITAIYGPAIMLKPDSGN